MGFPRQEYWSALPFPFPGVLPNPGIKCESPILQADSLPSEPAGKPLWTHLIHSKCSHPDGSGICLQCRRPQFDSWVGKILWRRDRLPYPVFMGFPCGSAGKESDCNVRNLGSIPGLGRYLEKSTATHSSTLAWRIPWTVESAGLQRVAHDFHFQMELSKSEDHLSLSCIMSTVMGSISL